jgi:hypothetical protein
MKWHPGLLILVGGILAVFYLVGRTVFAIAAGLFDIFVVIAWCLALLGIFLWFKSMVDRIRR